VTVGENSTDEMAGLWLGGEVQNDIELLVLLGANLGHYYALMNKDADHRERRRRNLQESSDPPPTEDPDTP
jgi:hypothetical protein